MPGADPLILSRRRACMALMAPSALVGVPRARAASDAAAAPASASYLDRLHAFKSNLVVEGPAPQAFKPRVEIAGAQQVVYPSGPLGRKARPSWRSSTR